MYIQIRMHTYIIHMYIVNSFLLVLDSPVEINKNEIEMIERDFSTTYWPWQLPNSTRKKMNKVRSYVY